MFITKPVCVSRFFSKNGCRIDSDSKALLRRLDLEGVVGANLNDGLSMFCAKTGPPLGLEAIAIEANCILSTVDVLSWRGILKTLMCHPYSVEEEEFKVIVVNSTLFIEHSESSHSSNDSFKNIAQTYYGFRFETVCLKNDHTGLKDEYTDNSIEWTHVYKARLGNINLVYGAEIDGLNDSDDGLVELKTTFHSPRGQNYNLFLEKLMHYWAQAYLVNVESIIVGFRDEKGIITKIERIQTDSIPSMVYGKVKWDPHVMIKHLYSVLDVIIQKSRFHSGGSFLLKLLSKGKFLIEEVKLDESSESKFIKVYRQTG